ncbi:MAG: hypothetical protein HKN39_01695 [Flavobacteriales bacterium]|nr:hypothetical protein [Flavobacteriales bacterium]
MTLFQRSVKVILILLLSIQFSAQDDASQYDSQDLNPGKTIEEIEWERVMEEVDYSETQKRKKKKKEEEKDEPEEVENRSFDWGWWNGLSTFVKAICIILLIGIVGFIIYKLTLLEPNKSFKTDRSLETRLEEAEQNLEESELEILLREAISKKEYKMAVRIYFLLMLQKLSEKDWITYKKEKTNFLYLLEMKTRIEYSDFRKLTYVFEYSWYGDVDLNESIFEKLQYNYRHFINNLEK